MPAARPPRPSTPAAAAGGRSAAGPLLLLLYCCAAAALYHLGGPLSGARQGGERRLADSSAAATAAAAPAAGGGAPPGEPLAASHSQPHSSQSQQPQHKFLMFVSGHQGSSALSDMLAALPPVFVPVGARGCPGCRADCCCLLRRAACPWPCRWLLKPALLLSL